MTSQMLGGEQGTDVEYVVTDDGVEPPVVEFGRLPTGTVSARAVYDNGVVEPISLGLNHFYLYEPSPSRHSRWPRVKNCNQETGRLHEPG